MQAASRVRAPRRAVDGVLVLDKPVGLTSTAALQRARRLLGAEKAGHTGTLDPLASGVLPLVFGAATKLSQVGLDGDKRYLATLALGMTTTTGDREGEVTVTRPVDVTRDDLERACRSHVGRIAQTPPMHSALKHEGRPLYDYARAGVEVEREAREVDVHAIAVVGAVEIDADTWTIDVRCSKGTYIRTLAESIGEALGCGAHLAALRRTESAGFTLDDAVTLDALEAMDAAAREARLGPADALVAGWPDVVLDADDAARFLTGLRRRTPRDDAAQVRVYGPPPHGGARMLPAFLGIARIAAGELIATRLLSPDEVGRIARTTTPTP